MSTADPSATGFRERLAARVVERRSQLVLGLDPDPAVLWPTALEAAPDDAPAAEAAAAAVARQCAALIEAAGPACVAVKLQLACFERLGAPGWSALVAAAATARSAGLLVIADGKRGDVPVTATAYAQALLSGTPTPWGAVPGLGADAITTNPLLGDDALEPLIAAARDAAAGVFVLVRTSNPGAADVQDLPTTSADGVAAPLWERLAARVDALDLDAVAGATAPEHLLRMRELMPRATFLLPGVGAQGGREDALGPAFGPGPAGGLVTVSRGIARASERHGGEPAQAARAEAQRLRNAVWSLTASA